MRATIMMAKADWLSSRRQLIENVIRTMPAALCPLPSVDVAAKQTTEQYQCQRIFKKSK